MSMALSDPVWRLPARRDAIRRRRSWGAAFVVAASLHVLIIAIFALRLPQSSALKLSPSVISVDVVTPAALPPSPLPPARKVVKTPSPSPQLKQVSVPDDFKTAPLAPSFDPAALSAPALPVAAAPPGNAAQGGNLQSGWAAALLARLSRFKRYPPEAAAARQQGVASLHFVIDRKGRVLSAAVEKSSGYDALDREVLAMVRRAQPLPPPPPQLTGDSFDIVLPIRFSLSR